jgi:DNA-binding NarL/FixJ family response regulator
MASGEAEVSVQPEIDSSADGAIRVIVADSEPIFRVGVRKIVAIEDDIRIVAQVESEENACTVVGRYNADLMLYESALSENPYEAVSKILGIAPALKIVLVTSEVTEQETVEMLRRGIWGVITRSIARYTRVKPGWTRRASTG